MALGRPSRTAGEVWPTAVAQGAKEAQGALAADLTRAVEARVVESRAVAAQEAELAVVPVAVRVGKQQVQLEVRELVATTFSVCVWRMFSLATCGTLTICADFFGLLAGRNICRYFKWNIA